MDIKIEGLDKDILEEALQQARRGRLQILDHMMETIDKPRPHLSPYAPKIITMVINPDKIGDVIGPSGRHVKGIIDETGVKIDIEQDGTIYISSMDMEQNKRAQRMIEDIVREVKVGDYYLGTVTRIEKFGAFVELFHGKEGLIHISELAEERVNRVEDVVNIGDEVLVKVIEIDKHDRINLSRKAVLRERKKRKPRTKSRR